MYALKLFLAILAFANCTFDLILYDFDETISCQHMFHLLSSKYDGYSKDKQLMALKNYCDVECVVNIFGGTQRINTLNDHFNKLKSNDIIIGILSFGYKSVIIEALKRVDLMQYFQDKYIFGRESLHFSHNLHRIHSTAIKSMFIHYKFKNIAENKRLFIDNDLDNMLYVKNHNVANIFDVDKNGQIINGLNKSQLLWIEQECNL